MNDHTANHHPSLERLKAYADGICDKTESLLIEVHLHYCTACSKQVGQFQKHLEAEVEQTSQSAPQMSTKKKDDLLAKILNQVDQKLTKTACEDLGIPAGILDELPDRKTWRWFSFWPSKGKVALLTSDINGPYDLFIGKLDGSSKTPSHSHKHLEQTVPILGEYVSNNQVFHKGDWSEMTPGDHHGPSSIQGGHCVCLIRSHRYGFRFTGLSWWRNLILASVHAAIRLQARIFNGQMSTS